MTLGQLGIGITIVTTLSTGLVFLLNKIVAKTRHETRQDDKLSNFEEARNQCIIERRKINDSVSKRLDSLEKRDTDREIMLTQIKEKMEALIQGHEHTQTMITQLTDHQQATFTKLIETIGNMGNKL